MSKTVIAFGIGTALVGPLLETYLGSSSIVGFGLLGFALVFYGIIAKEEESNDISFFAALQQIRSAIATVLPLKEVLPSFLFVFGTPLGDNNSATWVMMLTHYGPEPAHNCDIGFFDDDRKNIEHQWLVRHPNSPYPPPELAGKSQERIHVVEAGPEGAPGNFFWNPLDPDHQHYTVSVSCRDGVFEEKWEVTRVNGILRSRIVIERGPQWVEENPNQDPIIFKFEDPEFISAPLATELPKSSIGKVVHPGWKPKYRFDIPAAIIDPNGNLQILSSLKLPDGRTITDFGCWNILTRHFGGD